jgi:hypothetical protein
MPGFPFLEGPLGGLPDLKAPACAAHHETMTVWRPTGRANDTHIQSQEVDPNEAELLTKLTSREYLCHPEHGGALHPQYLSTK